MKKSIGLIVFYCCTFLLVAQHPYLRHFTVENGLPSSFIYHVFQDSKQFIWVATDKGVAHYDGYSFKIYDTNNGLPNNDVWSFFEDSQGRVWICSYMTHFAYYDYHDHKFHVIKNPNPETTSKIINYGFEIDGKVLFSDNRYGLVVEPQQGKIITKSQTQWRSDAKKQVYCLENNTSGIKLYNQTSPIHHLQTKPINWFVWGGNRHFLYFNKDSIWYDTPKGNYLKLVHQLSQSKDNYFSQLFPISHEKLLVVTKSDFFIIDSQLNRLYQYDFLKQYNVQTITEDNEKNIWVATKNDGVFLLTADVNHSQTWDLTKFNPPISNQVRAITSDTQGRVWLGTEDGNILYLKENVLQPLHFSQPNTQYIRSLCLFQENKLVACTNDYLSFVDIANIETYLGKTIPTDWQNEGKVVRKNGQTIQHYFSYHLPITTVKVSGKRANILDNTQLALSNSNRLYFVNLTENQLKFSPSPYQGRAYATAQDVNQNIWLATNEGLKVLTVANRLDTLTSLHKQYELLAKPISDIALDKAGNLWVATEGFGLYFLSPSQQISMLHRTKNNKPPFQFIQELGNLMIKNLAVSENNDIWLASNKGAYCLKMNADLSPDIQHFTSSNGLPTNEVYAVHATKNTVYIGTNYGFVRLDLAHYQTKHNYAPPIYFTNLKINHQTAAIDSLRVFAHTQNHFSFNYVCVSHHSNGMITYQYRMLSSNQTDTAWLSTQALSRDFPLLPPDTYTFQVRAKDLEGNITPTISFSFEISPPWWATTLFRVATILLLAGFIGLGVFARIRYIRRKEEAKSKIQQQISELELKALQAQLNEHFVFNALNAIQSFILKQDHLTANLYLGRFSDLIRLFLNASRKKYIALSDEIQLLKLFVDLETIRFRNKITTTWKIDESVDINVEIPSLLIQPYVENAFEHGFKPKNGACHLLISFHQVGNILHVIIDDDGIGRIKASSLMLNSTRKWEALGTKIITERVEVLQSQDNLTIEIVVIDKVDAAQNAMGTRVEIKIEV